MATTQISKKASADIWWIIIGAVIALVVLIIIMVIFTSKTTPLSQELGNCKSKGGLCMPINENCPQYTLPTTTFSCGETGKCCIGPAKTCTSNADCPVCTADIDGKRWCSG